MDEMNYNEDYAVNAEEIKFLQEQEKFKAWAKINRAKWIMILVSFFILFAAVDLGRTFYHESVHGAIFDSYGVSYFKGYSFGDINMGIISFYVQSNDTKIWEKCDRTCMALQLENEIFTYNMSALYYSLWMLFFMFLLKSCWDEAVPPWKRLNKEITQY